MTSGKVMPDGVVDGHKQTPDEPVTDEPFEADTVEDPPTEAARAPRSRRPPAKTATSRTARGVPASPLEPEPVVATPTPPAAADSAPESADGPVRGFNVALGLVVLLLAVTAGLGAAAILENRPAVYHSEAVLLIDEEPALTASGDEGILNKLTRLRIKYVDVVHTTVFSDDLSSKLGLPSARLHDALDANAPVSSLLLNVMADDHNAADAKRIAQSAAELLRTQLSTQQSAAGIKADQQVTLTVVTPATTETKTSPSTNRALLVGAVVFAAVLAGGLVLLDVLRRRRS